jgi:hypothetical protein
VVFVLLYVAPFLVDVHDGRLAMQSTVGVGATAMLHFPAHRVIAAAQAAAA